MFVPETTAGEAGGQGIRARGDRITQPQPREGVAGGGLCGLREGRRLTEAEKFQVERETGIPHATAPP